MDWLILALSSSLTSALVLFLVYFFLYRQFRQRFLFAWAVGWGFYVLRFLLELLQISSGPGQILPDLVLYSTLASGLFQMWGIFLFIKRNMPIRWVAGALIGALGGWLLSRLTFNPIWQVVPVFLIQAVVYIWIGIILVRDKRLESISRLITGIAFILWGLHKLDYPFLRPDSELAPWGFLLGALLGLIVAVGFILVYFQQLLQDHRQTEDLIRQGNESLNRLFQNMPVMLVGFDEQYRVASWNGECERVTGYPAAEVIGQPEIFKRFYPDEKERLFVFSFVEQSGYSYRNQEWTLHAKDGSQRTILWTDLSREIPVPGWKFWIVGVDVTDRKQVEARYASILTATMDGFWTVNSSGQFQEVNEAACQLTGYSLEELRQMHVPDIEANEGPEEIERHLEQIRAKGGDRFETRFRCKGGRIIDVEVSINYLPYESGTYIVFIRDITARKQTEKSLQERIIELEAVSRVSATLRPANSMDTLLPAVVKEVLAAIQAEVGGILIYDAVRGCFERTFGVGWADDVPKELLSPQHGPLSMVLRTGQPYSTSDASKDPNVPEELRPYIPSGWGGIALPLRAFSETVGIFMAFAPVVEVQDQWKMRLWEMLTEIVGSAIYQVRLRDRTQRSLNRMAALHEIDATIASSLDLRMTLDILLSQMITQLGVDATEVLLMNSQLQRLEGLAGRGFRIYRTEHRQIRPGEGPAGRALLERRLVEFHLETGTLGRSLSDPFYQSEGIREGFALPLISKGQLVGVITALNRKSTMVDADWIDFFRTLANQAALAIDDIGMVEKLRRSNIELIQSHSQLIEGLSRLVETRKGEREGTHQRLADLTVRLAESMGVPAAEWLNIRQGVLMHDIGLLTVPDAILHKQEPLTEQELLIYQRHPQMAYDLLNSSSQLRPILDIPYCHHEQWDGCGYPRGLKGGDIPLTARIFAVVNAWQELRSGPIIRANAWAEQPDSSILPLSGTQLDPQVVKVFLEMNKR